MKSIKKQLKKIYINDTQNTIIEDYESITRKQVNNINDVLNDKKFIKYLSLNKEALGLC